MAQGNEYFDWSLDTNTQRRLTADERIKKLVNGEWANYNYTSVWSFIHNEINSQNPLSPQSHFAHDFITADEKTAQDFFDKHIFQLARKVFRIWGIENLSDPNLTLEKNLYDAWERQLDSSEGFKQLRHSPHIHIDFYDIEAYYINGGGGRGMTDVENLSLVFGWSEFANSNENVGSPLANIGFLTVLDQQQKERAKAALLNAVKGNQANAPAPTVEQLNALNQCALMSDLLHEGWSYSVYPSTWTSTSGQAFDGRIYPVTTENRIDPNELINLCTVPNDIKTFFNDKTKNSDNLWWSLHWVYRDSEGLKDTEIYLKSDDPNNDYDPVRDLVNQGLLSQAQLKKWNKDRKLKGYTFKEIQVDYDGTNPSTARSDVKVTMTIEMDHISSLDTVCAYGDVIESSNIKNPIPHFRYGAPPNLEKKGGAAQVRLVDLITIPQVKTVDVTTPGGQGYHKNTFTPETSRIRLKVWYDEEAVRKNQSATYATETALILDLALVDHEIKRHDDAQNKTTLTITYRGYFEESMNAPYNDALVTSTIIQNRADRENALNEAAKRKCGDKLLREMQRLVVEQNRVETQQYIDSGGIIAALMDANKVYVYDIDQNLFSAGKIGNYLLTDYQYVDLNSIKSLSAYVASNPNAGLPNLPSSTNSRMRGVQVQGINVQRTGTLSNILSGAKGEAFYKDISKSPINMFVMLGDLINFALDSLYKPGTNTHYSHTKDMNMRFIVGTIKVPHPKDPTKSLTINPLQIPIDIRFFSSWYHDTIIKKGITSYAIGPFIKDLLERLVNDVIYDSCFSALTVDENPPQIRSCYFSDHSGKWFDWSNSNKAGTLMQINAAGNNLIGNTDAWFDPKDPYATGQTERILMKKDINAPIADSRNYCVIYQQFPSYFRQIRNGSRPLRNQPTTVDIYDGYNNKYNNFCSYTTFTKANPNSYLREARYFNNNFGVLALISNVYDLSFKIQTKKMNTCFYPGNIINFIVTDFGPSAFVDPTSLGESDPHTPNTRANILGYGGYYIITKVSYHLEDVQSVGSAIITITCKFLGTDANLSLTNNNVVDDIFIDEPQECVDAYNDQLDRLRVIDPKIASGFSVGVTTSAATAPINTLPVISTPPQSQRITTAASQKANLGTGDMLLAAMQFINRKSNLAVGTTKSYQVNDVLISVKMEGYVKTGVAFANQYGATATAIPSTVTDQARLTITTSDGRSQTTHLSVN